jgi:hypothetical protein
MAVPARSSSSVTRSAVRLAQGDDGRNRFDLERAPSVIFEGREMNIRAKKTMSGRPRRKVLWGVAGTMAAAAAVADDTAANPVKGGDNRDDWRLRTAEFLGISAVVPMNTTQTVSARCPSRTEVTGGGFVLSSSDLHVLTSQRSGNGWTVTVRNTGASTLTSPTARAVVECAAIVRDRNW